MKKKVVKLQELSDPEKFILIGISSHENDYRLSWALNAAFSLRLSKAGNIEIPGLKNTEKKSFSCFRYYDEDNMHQYMLVANTTENGYFFPEYKNIDFIFKLSGESGIPEPKTLIADLKFIEIVTLSFEIPPNTAKNTRYLQWGY